MKASFLLSILVLAAAAGCGEKNSASNTAKTNAAAASSSPLTGPVDYLGAAANAQKSAVKTVDTTSITKAVQMFQVDNGRLPKDLNELVEEKFLPAIPAAPYGTKIVYDAKTGEVKVVKQ